MELLENSLLELLGCHHAAAIRCFALLETPIVNTEVHLSISGYPTLRPVALGSLAVGSYLTAWWSGASLQLIEYC